MTPPFAATIHRELCLAAARHLLAEREARYPGLVEGGKLQPDAAADGLERARCIVAQWRWIVDPASPPLPAFDVATAGHFGAPDTVLLHDLRTAAERARAQADRSSDAAHAQLADLYASLAWLQRPPADSGLPGIVTAVEQARLATAEWRAARQQRAAA